MCEMARLELPVPPAFILTTEACLEYFREGTGDLPRGLDYEEQLAALEEGTGKKFGDPSCPLLVSVRSGASVSMPGRLFVYVRNMERGVRVGVCVCVCDPGLYWCVRRAPVSVTE